MLQKYFLTILNNIWVEQIYYLCQQLLNLIHFYYSVDVAYKMYLHFSVVLARLVGTFPTMHLQMHHVDVICQPIPTQQVMTLLRQHLRLLVIFSVLAATLLNITITICQVFTIQSGNVIYLIHFILIFTTHLI